MKPMDEFVQEDAAKPAGAERTEDASVVGRFLVLSSLLRMKISDLKGLYTTDHVSAAWMYVQTFDREFKRHRAEFASQREAVVTAVRSLLVFCPPSKEVGSLSEDFQRFLDGVGE